MRNSLNCRAKNLWHWRPRGEVVTGTEDQTSPCSLICDVRKSKSKRKLVWGQQLTGSLIRTQNQVSDARTPQRPAGSGSSPQTTVSSFLVVLVWASSSFQKACVLTLRLVSWDVRGWVGLPGTEDCYHMKTPGVFKNQSQEGLGLVWSSPLDMTRIMSAKVRIEGDNRQHANGLTVCQALL